MLTYRIEGKYCTITGYEGEVPPILKIPESISGAEVCSITDDAFKGCVALERVCLPDTVKMLGHNVFRDCVNLKEINLDNVTHFRTHVFDGTQVQFA